MARRSKAKMYDLVNRIIYLYEKEKMKVKDIESLLRSEGYDISKSSIHRTIKTHQQLAEEYKRTAEEVKALIEALKNLPATDMMEAIHAHLTTKLLEFTKQIESLAFDDPVDFVNAVSKLSKSLESLQKYREERLEKLMKKIEEEAKKQGVEEFGKFVIEELKDAYGL